MPHKIIFDHHDFLAVEKPVGIASVFERKKETECLIEDVKQETGLPLLVVHRLDKDVSGLVLFAKHPQSHKRLSMMFENRLVTKEYAAVVHGLMKLDEGEINRSIRQFGSGRMGVDVDKGKPSVTRYFVEKRCGEYTFLRMFPVTGRRHQLRVHAYDAGHPIVGDRMYGDRAIQAQYLRLMLHSRRIEFEWGDKNRIVIESPLPDAFSSFSQGLP